MTRDEFLTLGLTCLQKNDYEEAWKAFDDAAELDGNHAAAFHYRGKCEKYFDRYDQAIEDFDRAIALNPDYEDAYALRAVTQALQGYWDDALADADKVVALNPKNPLIYWTQGVLLCNQPRLYRDAIDEFTIAIHLDPTCALSYHWRGMTYAKLGLSYEALADFDAAIRYSNAVNLSAHHYAKGKFQSEIWRHNDAVETFTEAIRWLSALKARLNKTVLFYINCRDAYRTECAFTYAGRGRAYEHLKKFEAALEDYAKASSAGAKVSAAQGRCYEALEALEKN